jgi:hypothetical protein
MIAQGCKLFLLTVLGVCLTLLATAQPRLSISGTVADEKNDIVKGATVFISGTQLITATDDKGQFGFYGLNAGTYQGVVKLMGYAPFTLNIMIRQKVNDVKISLKVNPFVLKEVVIGSDRDRSNKYDLFKDNFLGTTKNGRHCRMLNPEILTLKYNRKKNVLEATSDDFLIIENAELGYRIKYLLKAFEYHYNTGIANYDGEASFEDMEGADGLKQEWKKSRLKAYKGSLMHFLRAIYVSKDNALKEGFLTNTVFEETGKPCEHLNARMNRVLVDPRQVGFDSLVTVIDTSFVSLNFHGGLFTVYYPKAVAKVKAILTGGNGGKVWKPFVNDASILQMALKEAVIDSRGNFTNYHAFLIRGSWGEKRVGDQLPFEYQPQ